MNLDMSRSSEIFIQYLFSNLKNLIVPLVFRVMESKFPGGIYALGGTNSIPERIDIGFYLW